MEEEWLEERTSRCGRGECEATDGSACWHFATGASTFLVGFHLVWGQRHKGELSVLSMCAVCSVFCPFCHRTLCFVPNQLMS